MPDDDDTSKDGKEGQGNDADGQGTNTDLDDDAKGKKAGTGDGDDVIDDQLSTKIDAEEVLEEYGITTPEEFKEFLSTVESMKGKIGDNDLDTLVENTKTLQKYQAEWQRQEEEKRREKETPEETIARLEKEKKDMLKDSKSKADRQKASRAAERALEDFNDTIDGVVKNAKGIPKEYRSMVKEFMGVDNPINEVDITDKAAVRRLTKDGIKKIQTFEQSVIKRYLDGKIKIPNIKPAEPAGGAKDASGKEPKNLKEAKRIMMESVGAFTGN